MTAIRSTRSLVGRNRLTAYFFLAFALSWGLQAALATQGIRLDSTSAAPWLLLVTLAPAMAALIVARLDPDPTTFATLSTRVRTWRLPFRWYVAGAAVAAMAALAGVAMFVLLGGSVTPQLALLAAAPIVLIGTFGEEVGWRGLALPGLLVRMAPLPASIVLGTVWGIWHTPAQLLDPTLANISIIAVYVPQTVGLSILLTWLILHTRGSILAAAVLHAAWNIVGLALPVATVEGRALFGVAVLLVAGFVIAIAGTSLAGPRNVQSRRGVVQAPAK
jgi:membrane protease YdiL (CAAX protease family)